MVVATSYYNSISSIRQEEEQEEAALLYSSCIKAFSHHSYSEGTSYQCCFSSQQSRFMPAWCCSKWNTNFCTEKDWQCEDENNAGCKVVSSYKQGSFQCLLVQLNKGEFTCQVVLYNTNSLVAFLFFLTEICFDKQPCSEVVSS